MTRIVYGVSGEGSGHSSRAREVARQLLASGHELRLASYDRGYRNLAGDFAVLELEGLSIATEENRVALLRTLRDNLSRLPQGWRRLREAKRLLFEEFAPEVVLCDFEPVTAYLAMHHDLPLVTLDNQHRMRYMRHPLPERLEASATRTLAVIRALVPRPDYSLITTFHQGELLNDRSASFPPILRREVLACEPESGTHILVYFTKEFASFLPILRGFSREHFVVYGQGRTGVDGNLHYYEPSPTGFLSHLRSAKGVVATAGFTLLTEALYLRKPLCALPLTGQFEQELNAHLLGEAGFGKDAGSGSAEALGEFLYRLPEYQERLANYPRHDNRALLSRLEQLLQDSGAEARTWHARRKA